MKTNTLGRVCALVFTFALMTACGREKKVEIDPQFSGYVEGFKTASGNTVTIDDLIIQFGDTENPRARGICRVADDSTPTIIVNQTTWEAISEAEREELIFHEMGHCVLGRKHHARTRTSGAPESIMYPFSLTAHEYESEKQYYHDELFGRVTN